MSRYLTWAEINITQLHKNIKNVKKVFDGQRKIMAIVKANGYGHGGREMAKFMSDKVDFFGVANVNEALEIESAKVSNPILILGLCIPAEYAVAIKRGFRLTISSVEMAQTINKFAKRQGHKAKVHIKVDTGMGRLGIPYRDAFEAIKKIVKLDYLEVEGLFTHFSLANERDSDYTDRQIDLFGFLIDELKKCNISFLYIHGANSAGMMNTYGASYFNMMRPGLLLYGYYNCEELKKTVDVKPILSLKSQVLFIKEIEQDKGISYGRNHIVSEKTRITVLPIGYSHGLPYSLTGKAYVLHKGKRYPVIGNVCMDYTIVDIGYESDIKHGDEVIYIGQSKDEAVTAQDWARVANTITYEILTRLSSKIPRLYTHG
ncbi:alanine racemase [Candidatus Omnitrophota bacterium]